MRMLRVIVGTSPGEEGGTHKYTDRIIAQKTCHCHTYTLIVVARLKYLARLRTAGGELEALVQATQICQRIIIDDLTLLHRATSKVAELPPPELQLRPWQELIWQSPK
eukprot:13672907-Alexandrium_andersonii.AAC.1